MTQITIPNTPAQDKGREASQTSEALIREAHSLLADRGITMGATKVTRAVRAFLARGLGSVTPFEEWILSALHADWACVNPYRRDPTGEDAVNHVIHGGASR